MSKTSQILHIVFRTKYSRPAIVVEHERLLYAYIFSFVREKKCWLYRLGGMPDHIHMLVGLHPTLSLSDFVRDLKVSTSMMLKQHTDIFPLFAGWAESYYAYSCGKEAIPSIAEYIKGQKEHHKQRSFRDELIDICRLEGLEVDIEHFMEDK